MPTSSINLMALDVGQKRIGVAMATSDMRIAGASGVIEMTDDCINNLEQKLAQNNVDILVVGFPRNQSGEATAQTRFVEDFVNSLGDLNIKIVYQDESLTSVIAEDRLKQQNKSYSKEDIDALAAAIILQDYLEANYG